MASRTVEVVLIVLESDLGASATYARDLEGPAFQI